LVIGLLARWDEPGKTPAFRKGAREHLPTARVVFDRFHLMSLSADGAIHPTLRSRGRRGGSVLRTCRLAKVVSRPNHPFESCLPEKIFKKQPTLFYTKCSREIGKVFKSW